MGCWHMIAAQATMLGGHGMVTPLHTSALEYLGPKKLNFMLLWGLYVPTLLLVICG